MKMVFSLFTAAHLVLAPAHCRADTSYYRTDSAPIRLSADRAADSETYRLDIASKVFAIGAI
jgi:hypothetical protein